MSSLVWNRTRCVWEFDTSEFNQPKFGHVTKWIRLSSLWLCKGMIVRLDFPKAWRPLEAHVPGSLQKACQPAQIGTAVTMLRQNTTLKCTQSVVNQFCLHNHMPRYVHCRKDSLQGHHMYMLLLQPLAQLEHWAWREHTDPSWAYLCIQIFQSLLLLLVQNC